MIRHVMRRALARLLAAAGLARASHVEHERRLAARIRAAERARASRQVAAISARLGEVTDKLRLAHERLAAERAECGTLRQDRVRLKRTEAELAARTTAARRLMRAQLAIRAKTLQRRGVTSAAARRAAHLASISTDYAEAAGRWRAGDVPADLHRVRIARLQWTAPAETAGDVSPPISPIGQLPLDDFLVVRDFAVGGIMLDIGARVGMTAVPRVVLGDFARVYAAEPDSGNYFCLVGNTWNNGCEGRVLPHRVAIGGSAGRGTVRRPHGAAEEVPFLTLDAWVKYLRIAPGDIRFMRVALQEWNLDVDRGATHLLKQRHIVWQIEISRAFMAASGVRIGRVCGRLAAHFTHITELGRSWSGQWRSAAEAGAIVDALVRERRDANLLLFNMRDVGRQEGRPAEPARLEHDAR